MPFLSQLTWRHATKKFDATKTLAPELLHQVLEAVRYAPTSFGLQPFYVKVVTEPKTKERLQAAGWGQAQFPTCAAVLVFVARSDVDQRIEEMLQARSGGKPEARMALADFEKMLKGFSAQLSPEQALVWAQKQCYIALGFALAACAELQMDSCPMEGFAPAEFDGILALPKGHHATVALTVGYADPTFKPFPKFRFSPADIVHSDR